MEKVSFRTNVLLKSIIGKDLITDDNIAVLELVKNSFDAGSSKVEVIFENIIYNQNINDYRIQNDSRIIISDIGVGMSRYDLINKWLNIAYSEKKTESEKFNRTLAGNKGVGRFSCDRLGKYLTIYTKQENTSNYIKLFIDWRKFEHIDDIDLNIQDIEFELEQIPNTAFTNETGISSFNQGTVLLIKSLRAEWNAKKILSLRKQLERLINPNQSFKSEKFDILIHAKEFLEQDKNKADFEKVNGLVENKIFEKLNFKVTSIQSKITRDGEYIISILKDRGTTIFTLVEKNPFTVLKNIKTHIYYLNPYSKAYFKRQTGTRSVDFGSISLFINGFRVPPYGDSGDDWLGMENRKNQGRNRHLGTREVIGRIEVRENIETLNDDENEFKIISNRSGVRNNKIFNQLTKNTRPYGFYFKIFRRLERFVVEGINWDSSKEKDYKKIEREILNNPNWEEENEEYEVDSLTRNKQILTVIEKIIDGKKGDIIKLKINRNFVSQLIDAQIEKTQSELLDISVKLKDKDLTPEQLNFLLQQITSSKKELNDLPINTGLINISPNHQKKIKNVNLSIDDTKDIVIITKEDLEEKLRVEEEAREKAEVAKKLAEEKAERLAAELELEKEKNIYLRTSSRSLSEDAKGLVHNIKITSKKISDSVDNIYAKILSDNYTRNQLLKSLGAIKFQSEKALKISKIITRSGFNTNKTAQIVDVVKYIHQYIGIYSDIYPKNTLAFEIIDNDSSLVKKISLLDISVILDDLISNSEKAKAKKILIEINNPKDDTLSLIFSDDGNGVPKKFLNNKEKIFELGITTTEGGSGIGLNSVKTGLKSMKGEIKFIGNNIKLKGACFEILFK